MSQRLLVFLTGLLLLSALASYVYYRRVVAQTPVDLWALVPDDAALVVATRNHPRLVRHLKETQLWDNLATVRYFQQVEENIALIDSLNGTDDALLRFLGTKNVLTSVHITGPDRFDLLFLVPVSSVREHRAVRTLLDALGRNPRFRVRQLEYHGEQLTQVEQRGSGESLTYYNYRNTLVLSARQALVEAVVQRQEHPGQPSIAADFGDTDYLQLKDVDATLLINYRQLPAYLGLFMRPELQPALRTLSSLGRNALLEMKLTGNRVLFNGFSNPETSAGSLHERLQGQPATRLRMAPVLSTRTALLVHLGAAPAALRRPAAPADTLAGALIDSVAATLDPEMALCYLATPTARVAAGRLALVRCPDAARTGQLLARLRRATGASPAFERFGNYQLHQSGVPGLAEKLLGPLFARDRAPGPTVAGATAVVGDYLALSDDPAALRAWLTDVVAGDVWSRSPAQVAFLQETTPLARLNIVVDTRNSWNVLLRALNESRRAGLLRNEGLFKRFPQMALQLAPHEGAGAAAHDPYYTQLVLRHPPVGPAMARPQNQPGAGSTLSFRAGLADVGPALVPLPGSQQPAVLVQDRAHVVHFVTPDNVVAWSDSLSGPLLAPARLLPLGPLRGPGYLMATAHHLYLRDANGRPAPNFPLNLPDTVRAVSLSSAPATEGQPARLLVADRYSNLFLFDTNGNAPAAWQPKRIDFALAGPPLLLTVGGRDVVVALLQNGYVFAYDGLGNTLPGFPISVGARLRGEAFVEAGASLGRTRLTVVNQHGELLTFGLNGNITQRRRVATWSRSSTFRLVPDQAGGRYVVVRDDGQGHLAVFEPTGQQLLEQRFVTSAEKPVQLFDFGAGRRVLVVTEPGPGKAYLYDARGRQAGNQPFDSDAPTVGLTYEAATNTYQLYRFDENELKRTALRLN